MIQCPDGPARATLVSAPVSVVVSVCVVSSPPPPQPARASAAIQASTADLSRRRETEEGAWAEARSKVVSMQSP